MRFSMRAHRLYLHYIFNLYIFLHFSVVITNKNNYIEIERFDMF